MNALRENKKIIYNLKKRYGTLISLRRIVSKSADLRTGKQIVNYDDIKIRKAVIMPFTTLRSFSYPLSYIAANKNFTYGALYDQQQSTILIGRNDLPKDFRFTNDHRVVINDQMYNIIDHVNLPDNAGILFNIQLLGYDNDVN